MASTASAPLIAKQGDVAHAPHLPTVAERLAAEAADKIDEPPATRLENKFESGGLCCPNLLSCFLGTVCFCAWCGACNTVDEKTEKVLLNWGKFQGVVREPGCYCWNPFGMSPRVVSTARAAIDLTHVKVADFKGNPLMVSGVVTYVVVDSRKAALDVQNVNSYIQTQAMAVLKRIASMYPYEAKEGEHSLKTEASRLRTQMVRFLQDRVNAAGVLIINFELTDLAYAPEIANAMLIRQQAEALVDARKIIVEGAVHISYGALAGLAERGVRLTKDQEAMMVTNLLCVICGDSKVTPTVNVGTSAPAASQFSAAAVRHEM